MPAGPFTRRPVGALGASGTCSNPHREQYNRATIAVIDNKFSFIYLVRPGRNSNKEFLILNDVGILTNFGKTGV